MFSVLYSVESIRKNHASHIGLPNKCGVYKWWCEKDLFEVFLKQLNTKFGDIERYVETIEKDDKTYYCFYVGQTKSQLSRRIKSEHIGKFPKKNRYNGSAIKASTLRESINALKDNTQKFDEDFVDCILNKCMVQWAEIDSSDIDRVEKETINSYIRILNRDDFEKIPDQNMQNLRDTIAEELKRRRTSVNKLN